MAKVVNPITVVALSGIIHYSSEEDSSFAKTMHCLGRVIEDKPKAKTLILRINSPGGTVAGSDEIYRKILHVKKSGVKVVALMEDVAASGGLYIALAADKIIANPGTITGSIGVIMRQLQYGEVLKRFNIGVRTVKSVQHKDILSPLRDPSPEEEQILQDLIQGVHGHFTDLIASSRNLEIEKVRQFADGRIFNGVQAKALGLVDDVGGFPEAIACAEQLAGIPAGESTVRTLSHKKNFLSHFKIPGMEVLSSPFFQLQHAGRLLFLLDT